MPSVQFTALGGFDYGPIIDQLVNLKRVPIHNLEQQKSDLEKKAGLVDQLSTKLSGLRDTAKSINNITDFLSYTASSTDESKVTASANGTAQPTSFSLEINALATSTKTYSTAQNDKGAAGLYGSGTMDIVIGGSTVGTINVDASSTMESIVNDINALNVDVQASVFYDGSQYRILAVGKNTGVANDVTFTENGTTIGLDSASAPYREAAQDASITIDGTFTVTNSTNTITGVIEGLTLDLNDTTAAGETVEVKVEPDADATVSKVQDFVDHYNSVASFLNYQLSYNGAVKGPDTLFGDYTARSIQSSLSSIVTAPVSGLPADLSALSMIGIKTQRDGTLTFDTAKFKEKLAEDPSGVARLFADDASTGTTGITTKFESSINGFIDSPNGSLVTKKKSLDTTVERLEDTIDKMEQQLDSYESMLYKQFESMTRAISDMQYQGNYLSSVLPSSSTPSQ